MRKHNTGQKFSLLGMIRDNGSNDNAIPDGGRISIDNVTHSRGD